MRSLWILLTHSLSPLLASSEEADYMIADAQPDKDGYIAYKKFVDKIK